MKIGIEVQRLFRKKKFGIETSSLELIKNLIQVEPNHEYVIFAKNDEDRACLTESKNVKIKLVSGRLFADFEQIFLPIAARNERVDLLHCTGNTAPYFCSAPIIQTLHDVIFMDAIPEEDSFYQRFGNHYRRKIVPNITHRSKAVITVSEYEKERIINRLGIARDKVHVVYNGINEKRFFKQTDRSHFQAVQTKYSLPESFILFLGNPSFRKNSSRVIEAYVNYAAKADNPIPLVTPGLPQKFVADKLRELQYPYDNKTFITPGYIDDNDLPSVYGASKIFLFPSLSEGFGMPVIEAMACGTPVITSNTSSMPEIAGNAARLVDPLNASEIADAIISLSVNEALRVKNIQNGFINAAKFKWTHAAEKVLNLYKAVLQEASNPERRSPFVQKQVVAARD